MDSARIAGSQGMTRGTLADRFWAHVEKTDSCWLWAGNIRSDGYGRMMFQSKRRLVHRIAYELLIGPIPEGLTIDHVWARGCRYRRCVNPDHLEAVPIRENILRGNNTAAQFARRDHCNHGHALSGENVRVTKRNERQCVTCKRESSKREYRKKTGKAA
jgi:hypothetical protein